ncbi:MAG: restriction endonuclease [Bacilli bacterium]|nr:restriction endonuclease [Bacilli bacterium]
MNNNHNSYTRLMEIIKNNRTYVFQTMDQINYAIERANEDIDKWLNALNNISKNVVLDSFNSEEYYNKMMTKLEIDLYKPIEKPNERKIRKEVGCIKENKFLEKIFKDRREDRLKKGKEFEKVWNELYSKYEIEEKNNYEEYEKYKKNILKEHKKENKKIYEKKELFLKNNATEINEILEKYIQKIDVTQKYGVEVHISYNNEECNINLRFPKYDDEDYFLLIKRFFVVKSQSQLKGTGFSDRELEENYETYVFNVMLLVGSKIMYYLKNNIKKVTINCYSNVLNNVNGEIEDTFFISTYFLINDINFSKLNFIDAKSFFNNQNMRVKYPLINYNKIMPFSTKNKTAIDVINNDIDGFAFEKLSKQLLEKNGFDNVEVTKASGDYGADVIAFKDGVKYAIQCKKFSSSVGVKAIQEVIASKSMYHCHVGVVLTNNFFTPNAIKLAESNGVLLWNKTKLEEMIGNSDYSNTIKKSAFNKDVSSSIKKNSSSGSYFHANNVVTKKVSKDNDLKLENEMNDLDLEDWQKDLVRKGNYDPENFEEEDLEEDDYYYDDIE